ncbi:uncharacterized protein LOC120331725 [Styela clava]
MTNHLQVSHHPQSKGRLKQLLGQKQLPTLYIKVIPHHQVSELDISGNQMNKQAFKSLGSALASIDGKEMGLKLQMCGLTKDKTDALGRNSGFKIHTLDVRNNSNITFDLFLAIAKVATQSEVENLLTDPCEELHLTTEQLMELSKWKTCGKIRTLDVRNNSEITFDLFLAIAKVATQSEVKNLLTDPCEELHATTEQLMELSKWKTCGKLDKLDVSGNKNLGTAGWGEVGKVVLQCQVKAFEARNCNLTAEGMEAFKENTGNAKLDKLVVSGNENLGSAGFAEVGKVVTQCHVKEFEARNCNLRAKGMKAFRENTLNAKIHTLDVRNNSKITFDLFLAIAKVATQSEVKNLLTDPCGELHPTTEQLIELSKWKTCGKLNKLDVSGNKNLGTAGWGEVGKVVLQCQVKTFEAWNCNLTAEGMEAFKENTGNAKLDKLDVSGNKNLGITGFGEVGKVVTQCRVRALDVRDCNLTAEGMKALKENTGNAKLYKLDVSKNEDLGTAGFGEVGLVVSQCQVNTLEARNCNLTAVEMKAFKGNTCNAKLYELDVSHNNLGPAGWGEVGLVVSQCQVETFKARNCYLTADKMKAFKENTRNAKLDKLDVSGNKNLGITGFGEVGKVVTQCRVRALDVRDCNLTAEGMKALRENTGNAKLDKLDVSGNRDLGTAGFGEVGLVVSQCQVKIVDVSWCNLTAVGMKAFKENIPNAKLYALDVSYNDLGPAGWGEVGLVVSQCQVKTLVAQNYSLTAEEMKAFKENTRNAKIIFLDLSGNNVTKFGLEWLTTMSEIVHQCQVKTLKMRNCSFIRDQLIRFKELIADTEVEFID